MIKALTELFTKNQ
jgi:hypothetical protein